MIVPFRGSLCCRRSGSGLALSTESLACPPNLREPFWLAWKQIDEVGRYLHSDQYDRGSGLHKQSSVGRKGPQTRHRIH